MKLRILDFFENLKTKNYKILIRNLNTILEGSTESSSATLSSRDMCLLQTHSDYGSTMDLATFHIQPVFFSRVGNPNNLTQKM